jgi:putative transposase
MPNHFHLVIEPGDPSALSKFMQWLLTSHVRRYHRHYHSSGHVWQGRFKSFPVQRDEHLVTVLRYVAQNPVRAGLASSPAEWIWSSAKRKDLVDPLLIDVPPDLDIPLSSDELDRLHESVSRQRPYGSPSWQEEIAKKLGLLVSMRPRGRPKTVNK